FFCLELLRSEDVVAKNANCRTGVLIAVLPRKPGTVGCTTPDCANHTDWAICVKRADHVDGADHAGWTGECSSAGLHGGDEGSRNDHGSGWRTDPGSHGDVHPGQRA